MADAAAALAGDAPDTDALPTVMEALRRGLDARDCSIWTFARGGLVRAASARSSDPVPPVSVPCTGIARVSGNTVAPVSAGARALGVLSVASTRPLGGAAQRLLATVADMLVPVLLRAEQSRRFAAVSAEQHRELEEQHKLIARIVDSLPVGLHVVDRDYRIHAWNRRREVGMQGVRREDAIGRTIFEVLRRQPAELLRREFDAVFASGEASHFEMESEATGARRLYRVSKIPMCLDDGAVTHVITIGEDITESRLAQEQVAHAQKLAALGQLSAGAMHEINNPLATIGACAETMAMQLDAPSLDPALRESFAELCGIIEHEVHRAKRIVDGLLDFTRPKLASRTPVRLRDVVDETLFLLKHHERFKTMRVETTFDAGDEDIVLANAEQLLQVLMALLFNAGDAMNGEGTVQVRTVRQGDEASLEVIDTGHGIASSELGKLFEPFYTTKPPGRGTGLGLSICWGIIADHGGRIDVESTVGRGSTFRVRLPAAERRT